MIPVSVLIAAYNAEKWLAEAIESALGQTHPHVEVIVVDDGSTDGTYALAQSFEAKGVRVIHQENQGACVARNRALAKAQGEFVKFLDADDALATDAIAVQLEHLARCEEGRRIVPFGDLVPTDEWLTPQFRSSPDDECPPDQLFSQDVSERIASLLSYNIQTSLPLHRREWLLEIGGFRPHLKRGQEFDLHLRLALSGVCFLHVSHIGAYIRQHSTPGRITNTSPLLADPAAYLAIQVDRRKMIEAELGTPLPPAISRILARSIWRHTRRLMQAGESELVDQFVAEARLLDPSSRYAGRLFRALNKLWGPTRAERTLTIARQLTGRS